MAKIKAENVTVHCDGYRRNISCECNGHRYHIWLDSDFKPVDGILYKNPPLGAKPQTEGFFYTRKLSIDSSFGSALLQQMMERAGNNDLFRKALIDEGDRTNEDERRRKAEALVGRKESEGVALFDLLADIIKADVINGDAAGLRARIIAKLRSIDDEYEPEIEGA